MQKGSSQGRVHAEAEMRPHQALQTRYYFPQGKTAACPEVA
jgi:hypothetical protein